MFERVVCWDSERITSVLDKEAENTAPEVFMATHSTLPLALVENADAARFQWTTATRRVVEPEDFLAEFLSPSKQHVQAVVLGDAGTGKSHLVEWVRLNVPRLQSNFRIISIPRAGTSLKNIVGQLINELPVVEREAYHQRLRNAPASGASREDLQIRIIAELIVALQHTIAADEKDEFLLGGLRAFLADPNMLPFHIGNDGIIAELARHVSEPGALEIREARRQFTPADLRLDEATTRLSDFALPTKQFLQQVLGHRDEYEGRCIELINNNLSRAVATVLGFSGDELVSLMRDIRRHLRSEEQELILLFEDFARAEGIDGALLDALMERSGPHEDSGCVLRWMIAVTTGYYEQGFLDTHKQRMDFVIDMDAQGDAPNSALDEENLFAFAARYLNALRVPAVQLESWFVSADGPERGTPPTACDSCPHRDECHSAFGAVRLPEGDEVGLYPFSKAALKNMSRRRGILDRFNPRALLNDVIWPICDTPRTDDLGQGRFPDKPLVDRLGGSRLPPGIQIQVNEKHPADAAQYRALLELWSPDVDVPSDLDGGIFRAFGLLPLRVSFGDFKSPPPPGRKVPPTGNEELQAHDPEVEAIRIWGNGGVMPQGVAQSLRVRLFAALDAFIDWDAKMLNRAAFAAPTGQAYFRQVSITFTDQETNPPPPTVRLELPLEEGNEERLRTAHALEGIVRYHRQGDWDFPEGGHQLIALVRLLERCSEEVMVQLRSQWNSNDEWQPLASAAEVLTVGSTLASQSSLPDITATDLLDTTFAEWPDPKEVDGRSEEWRALYKTIHSQKAILLDTVRAHSNAGKGGRQGTYLDAAALLPHIRRVTTEWKLQARPTEHEVRTNLARRYARIIDLHAKVARQLPRAVQSEREMLLAWLTRARASMPAGTGSDEVAESLKSLVERARSQAIPIQKTTLGRFESTSIKFEGANVGEATRAVEHLEGQEQSPKQLPTLAANDLYAAIGISDEYFEAANDLLTAVRNGVEMRESEVGDRTDLARDIDQIERSFAALEAALPVIGADRV